MIAKRSRPGKTSRKISSRLAVRSAARFDRPVTLPPGRASEATIADWVPRYRENNRYQRGRLLRRKGCLGSARKYEINFGPNEFGCDLGHLIAAPIRPAIVDGDGAALDPAEFAQPLHKSGDPLGLEYQCGRAQVP